MRKIVQFTNCDGGLLALCDDGSFWYSALRPKSENELQASWFRLPPIPEDIKEKILFKASVRDIKFGTPGAVFRIEAFDLREALEKLNPLCEEHFKGNAWELIEMRPE